VNAFLWCVVVVVLISCVVDYILVDDWKSENSSFIGPAKSTSRLLVILISPKEMLSLESCPKPAQISGFLEKTINKRLLNDQ
jgi:hypothetical protein